MACGMHRMADLSRELHEDRHFSGACSPAGLCIHRGRSRRHAAGSAVKHDAMKSGDTTMKKGASGMKHDGMKKHDAAKKT
ncbi:hypothetical protein CH75_03155 [Dyella jiangningensis]|nr:hypothetical protein CH75_03155 [Dyella jiangningensis]